MDDLELIVRRLVHNGFVTDTDVGRRMVRVKFPELDETSGWLPVLQRVGTSISTTENGSHTHDVPDGTASESGAHTHTGATGYWMPNVNDQVLVLYLPILDADGFVIGGIV